MVQATDSPRPQPPTPAAVHDKQQRLQQRDQQAPASEKLQKAVNNNHAAVPGPAPEPAFNAPIDPNLESLSSGPQHSLSAATTTTTNTATNSLRSSSSSAASPPVPSVASSADLSPPVADAAVAGRELHNGQNGHGGHGGENGEVVDHEQRHPREGGDATPSPAPSMSTPQGPHGHQRQMGHYQGPTGYPGVSMPGAQYAYAAATGQMGDPYRGGPTAMNSAMSLPSMRSIDPMQHNQAHAHAMHMGAPMGAPIAHPAAPMTYYGQPFMHDPNAMRFPLQPLVVDPRGAMTGGRHKKVGTSKRPVRVGFADID
jgi:hypothetical protein